MKLKILISINKLISCLIPFRKYRQLFRERFVNSLKWKLSNQSFSQEGEDLIILRHFKEKKNGFYIDIGAHHPFRFSNTALLYKIGWNGINIDATLGVKQTFDKERVRDINIEALVSNETDIKSFYMFDEPALNTCDFHVAQRLIEKGNKLIKKLDLESISLKKILEDNINNGQVIDFLSIDVEGHGYEVLSSNDWLLYRPEIIAIEVLDTVSIEDALLTEESIFLKDKDYFLFSKTVNTLIFKKLK